jgi:hypothetical protein
MNRPQQTSSEENPIKQEIESEPQKIETPKSNRGRKIFVIILLAAFLILIISGIALLLLLKSRGIDIVEKVKDYIGEDETESDLDSERDTGLSDSDGEIEEINGNGEETVQIDCTDTWMASGWNTYTNSSYGFSLKHTKDVFVEEETVDVLTEKFSFTVGYEPLEYLLFTVWIQTGGSLDENLNQFIITDCTTSVDYSNVEIGDYTFRKAVNNEDATCLSDKGIERYQPYKAYAYEFEDNLFFVLRNDRYNDEQEKELLCSIRFD